MAALRRGLASGLVALALALAASAPAEPLFLHVIPVKADEVPLEAPLRLRMFASDPASLAAAFPTPPSRVKRRYVDLELAGYPVLSPERPLDTEQASFLIDYQEPELRALRARLVELHGASPGPEALRAFTHSAIPKKTMARGWDLASRVALHGEGDCTEHAVLLTALARSVGMPSRVVLGLVVVRQDGETQALGHAWSEVREDGRWRPLDATTVGHESEERRYLPLGVVEDEGPGYSFALGRTMQRTWVKRLEIEAAR